MNTDLAKQLEQSVRDFYADHGDAFSRTRQSSWPEERFVAGKIQPGMTVVDIGAGNGRFATVLPKGVTFIGFEPSASLRSHAPSLDIREGGFPTVPVNDASADVAVSFAVFHHLVGEDAREQAVEELVRITKSGGIIAATSWFIHETEFENVDGGNPGDVWIPWRAEGSSALRFVHQMQTGEWEKLWSRPEIVVEQIGMFGRDGFTTDPKEARNWFVIARKK